MTGLRKFLFGQMPPPASSHRHWHKIGRVHLHEKEYLRYEVTETEIHDASELRNHEIVLRLYPNVLPDVHFYELDRVLRDHLPRSGLILIGGSADADVPGLIAGLVRWSVEDRTVEHRAVIYALPEYSFTQEIHPIGWEKSSILQIETPAGVPLMREMVLASSIGADMVAFGHCQDSATMELALTLAAAGKRVFVGVGAGGVMNTVARALALLSRGRGDDYPPCLPELALNLRTVVSQKMVRNLQGSMSALQEYLVVGPKLREALLQTPPSGWLLPVLKNFEEEGESFAMSASAARNNGIISAEVCRRVVKETSAPIVPVRPRKMK
jgi:Tfp pilus assembly pilus retraction ATPase PilT